MRPARQAGTSQARFGPARKHTCSGAAPADWRSRRFRGVPRNLLGVFQPLIEVVEGNHLRVIVYGSLGGSGRRALGTVPPFEMAQDSLDDWGAVDQAYDLERAATMRANQRVRFVHLLDQPRPGAPQPAEELAIVLETEAEHLGDGHDILTNGQIAQNVSIGVFGKQQGALLMA